jgi:hypothetical protein
MVLLGLPTVVPRPWGPNKSDYLELIRIAEERVVRDYGSSYERLLKPYPGSPSPDP